MLEKRQFVVLLLMLVTLPGCGGVQSVPGGTKGTVRAGDEFLSDIQVTVHQVDGGTADPVGFGVTGPDGSFELVTNGAHGPLWLSPGEYRCTLESAGSPVQIPKEYAQPGTTPLKIAVSAADSEVDLEIPAILPTR